MSDPTVVSLHHVGCARNLIDSELILARMAEEGCTISADPELADVAVVNTCSFIGPARTESEAVIRAQLERKRRGEISSVVVAGCLVQRYQRALLERFPEVDLFAEISDYRALARAVRDLRAGAGIPRYLASGGLREATRDAARLLSTPASYAYLRVSHGCDHTCSFCAIPAIRGPHRSKSLEGLVAETRELIEAQVKEIVLVAEDLTAWGRDMGLELPELVERLAELPGDHRLRLMYAYPNRFPWRLLPLLRDHPRVIPYLDIPIQHVSTPVLRAMLRSGDGAQVRSILDRILEEVPGITLRTTILLGFPGETDADVESVVDFIREYRIARLGLFVYSREEGTPSYEMDAQVPGEVAQARFHEVSSVRTGILREAQNALVGERIEILVDEADPQGVLGRGAMDAPEVDLLARVAGCTARPGERLSVEVSGVDEELDLLCRLPDQTTK